MRLLSLNASFIGIFLLFGLSNFCLAQQSHKAIPVVPGVSLELANYRKSIISDIEYDLAFSIPSDRSTSINAQESISFIIKPVGASIDTAIIARKGGVFQEDGNIYDNTPADKDLQIDFKQKADQIKFVHANGKNIPIKLLQEHLVVDRKYLTRGKNLIEIDFIAGDASLNRNNDYLYALFVPDRARTVFPCFDQPDMKAIFNLVLHVPNGWKVLANGVKGDSVVNQKQTTYVFKSSDLLPTYLFSFTAGKYNEVKKMIGNYQAEFLHRETDSAKIKFSVDSIFTAHQNAITFLESWTGIKFPFQKVGFVAIPDFQFGGMEHPGEVQYKASSLFLDEGATKDQFIARSNLISHETAHMWFGDMVTMKWFNDVWMKEVFANFMADKVTEKMMGSETFNLKFLLDHYPAAYGVDRTQGANPIRQQLSNLQDAGSLYGNIIYHKAPIMMRQLELLMGKENFQKGIREYLKKYAYGNATWNDLITILSKYSKANLYEWNKVWVNQPGRPVFDYIINYTGDYRGGVISDFTIKQHPETGAKRIWPQAFQVTLIYTDHSKVIPVNMNAEKVLLKEALGQPAPLFVLFNSSGQGYGVFPVDRSMLAHLYTLKSPLMRASAYINLYENMLAGKVVSPQELLTILRKGLLQEPEELNLRLLTGYISSVFWQFTSLQNRQQLAASLETELWQAMQQQKQPNSKKILLKTYQGIFLSGEARNHLYEIWKTQKTPEGVKFSEDDYTSLALSLALRDEADTTILKQQLSRIKNPDRQKRLQYLIPALSGDEKIRDAFFTTLKTKQGREKEAWVATALSYLHHPLRQKASAKYLTESLNLLKEIQLTGDIFFPGSWLDATFGSYQSKAVVQIVSDFLKKHPNYNPKLKAKILQSADNVFRAEKLVR